jgi:hypothetical protein
MDKEDILTQLNAAKQAHLGWVKRAKSLIEGTPVEQNQIPVECTACGFGQWFYSDGQGLKAIPGMDILKVIEEEHTSLHDMYAKIFTIYFTSEELSFLSKLFGKKKKIPQEDQEMAVEHFTELQAISVKLLAAIDKLERRISALPLSSFER